MGGGIVEITTRTVHSRMLLKPSRACVLRIHGVLGRSLALHPGIKLYAYWFLSNHYHLLLWAPDSTTLTSFMTHLNGNLAREIGELHGWNEKFWGRRYTSIAVLGRRAQLRRLKYILAQGTKEGLVARPSEWPGASCLGALLDGRPAVGVWYDRTSRYRSDRTGANSLKDFGVPYRVELTPLPCLETRSSRKRRAIVRELVSDIERSFRKARKQKPVFGVSRILGCNPHDAPNETARRPAPFCHSSSPRLRAAYIEAYQAYSRTCEYATARLRRNVRTAIREYPKGAFAPRTPFLERTSLGSTG